MIDKTEFGLRVQQYEKSHPSGGIFRVHRFFVTSRKLPSSVGDFSAEHHLMLAPVALAARHKEVVFRFPTKNILYVCMRWSYHRLVSEPR